MYLNESAQPGPPTCDTATAFCRPVPDTWPTVGPALHSTNRTYQIGH
jgi:hypothetical protein